MRQLFLKAVAYDSSKGLPKLPMRYLYRNKPRAYFADILGKDGIMYKYTKHQSGDPRSPINESLEGLFFRANVERATLKPFQNSSYGDTRLLVPFENLLEGCEFYFTDFYCVHSSKHHLILVVCKRGSSSDHFCTRHLLPFNPFKDNSFFYVADMAEGEAWVSQNIRVEICYTENIDLRRQLGVMGLDDLSTVHSTESIRPPLGGAPKDKTCSFCNLRSEVRIQQ